MEKSNQQSVPRFSSSRTSGERRTDSQNMTEQPNSFNDERNITEHRSPNETISGSISGSSRIGSSTIMNQSHLQGYEQSNYVNPNNLHVNPLNMYNENTQMAYGQFPSMPIPNSTTMFGGQPIPALAYELFPSMPIPNSLTMFGGQPIPALAYGQFPSMPIPNSLPMFAGQPFPATGYGQFPSMLNPNYRTMFGGPPFPAVAYDQLPPMQIPNSPTMFGGPPFPAVAYDQLPPMQIPNSPTMFGGPPFPAVAYDQLPPMQIPNSPTMFGGREVPSTDAIVSVRRGPSITISGTSYYAPPGSFASRAPSVNISKFVGSSDQVPNSLVPIYQQPMGGIRRPYEESVMQQAPMQGIGYASNTSQYLNVGSYGVSQYGGSSYTQFDSNQWNRLNVDNERDSISYPSECVGSSSDRNRGPRASKSKKNTTIPALQIAEYNRPDFCVEYENAKFYAISSISVDKVHDSIRYGIWSGTVLGIRKLKDAYRQAKSMTVPCPIFLFFSVMNSGKFCGIAEMVGPVEYEKDAKSLQQQWIGKFSVRWHIIKNVPNNLFCHILLENDDNTPVTHSVDTREVKLESGIQMMKIFKEYKCGTSLLDNC